MFSYTQAFCDIFKDSRGDLYQITQDLKLVRVAEVGKFQSFKGNFIVNSDGDLFFIDSKAKAYRIKKRGEFTL